MNDLLSKPLEFEGIRIGNSRGPFNCGEFAAIGYVRPTSNPIDFDGIDTSVPTRQPHADQH